MSKISEVISKDKFEKDLSLCHNENCHGSGSGSGPLSLSVITLCIELNTGPDLDFIYLNRDKVSDLCTIDKDNFHNCLKMSIKHNESKNIIGKIFKNGKIQLPGCRTIDTVNSVPIIIENILKKFNKDIIIVSKKIATINVSFKVNIRNNIGTKISNQINQIYLKNLINELRYNKDSLLSFGPWFMATLSVRYAAINAKYLTNNYRKMMSELPAKYKKSDLKKIPGKISVLIFKTGSVIITGAKSSEEILETYTEFMKLITDDVFL